MPTRMALASGECICDGRGTWPGTGVVLRVAMSCILCPAWLSLQPVGPVERSQLEPEGEQVGERTQHPQINMPHRLAGPRLHPLATAVKHRPVPASDGLASSSAGRSCRTPLPGPEPGREHKSTASRPSWSDRRPSPPGATTHVSCTSFTAIPPPAARRPPALPPRRLAASMPGLPCWPSGFLVLLWASCRLME